MNVTRLPVPDRSDARDRRVPDWFIEHLRLVGHPHLADRYEQEKAPLRQTRPQ